MKNDPNRVENLFRRIATLEPSDRPIVLDWECGEDAQERKQVEDLLQAANVADETEAFNLGDEPTANYSPQSGVTPPGGTTADHTFEIASDSVFAGRYLLQEKIGEGGMGEVWRAQQTEPVKRPVALKLIKFGLDSRAMLARFEQERQALAMMDHPHIAHVLEGGMTPAGQPYFVMELVNGFPLTEFCDKSKLSPRARLALFVLICRAIQHAHQKGIIHRDLKPANILVTQVDGQPVPKIIDFGLAKAIAGKLTDESMATQAGAVIGTLGYMPPEQALGATDDIDTRADVYSLGVILYELLTGLRPVDADRMKQEGLAEMVRGIQEDEVPRPSTRLSTDDSFTTLAAMRSIEPRKLEAMLRGELDWVVMKCLEKERERRYETVNALVRDIERYLCDEPVEARPPSVVYRLRKLIRRNKVTVVCLGFLAMAFIIAFGGTMYGLVQAETARGEAVTAQQAEARRAEGERLAKLEAKEQARRAIEAAAKEREANRKAQQRLVQITKSNDILGSIFESLDPKEIAEAKRPLQAILVEKLEAAAAQLEGESIGDALVVAAMQDKLGKSLKALGAPKKAIVLLKKSQATYESQLGRDHHETQFSLNNLALAYKDDGKPALALPLLKEAFQHIKAKFGPDHAETLTCMGNLGATYQDLGKPSLALPYFKECHERRKAQSGGSHPDTLFAMNNLAFSYLEAGQLRRALPIYEAALKLMKAHLGKDHPHTITCMGNLASTYEGLGQIDRALPLFETAAKVSEKKLGIDHPDTLLANASLAAGYQSDGQLDRAVSLCEKTLKRMKSSLGSDHPHTLVGMNNLASAYQASGKLKLAMPLFEKALERQKAALGPNHPSTLTIMGNLASVYQDTGKIKLAMPLFEKALQHEKETLGADHPNTLRTMNNLAAAYWSQGLLKKSIPLASCGQLLSILGFGGVIPSWK